MSRKSSPEGLSDGSESAVFRLTNGDRRFLVSLAFPKIRFMQLADKYPEEAAIVKFVEHKAVAHIPESQLEAVNTIAQQAAAALSASGDQQSVDARSFTNGYLFLRQLLIDRGYMTEGLPWSGNDIVRLHNPFAGSEPATEQLGALQNLVHDKMPEIGDYLAQHGEKLTPGNVFTPGLEPDWQTRQNHQGLLIVGAATALLHWQSVQEMLHTT